MADSSKPLAPSFDVGYGGHQLRQACLGLELTPAQRLTWLEDKVREMRGFLGKARSGDGGIQEAQNSGVSACESANKTHG